mgnify:CR=1 FL=1
MLGIDYAETEAPNREVLHVHYPLPPQCGGATQGHA